MNAEEKAQERLEKAVREILCHADTDSSTRLLGIHDATQRRELVRNINRAVGRFDLRDEIDAYLARNKCASPSGLPDRELIALSTWLDSTTARLSVACDPPGSPSVR
jgi:hypothetical protein